MKLLRKLLLFSLMLSITNCKAQKMINVKLDPQGESKQLYDNSDFKKKFENKGI